MMNLIKVKISPLSSFVTFPKGDTIFGHFAHHSFLKNEEIFTNYINEKPKIIFSDILPDGYLYKPALPLESFGVKEEDRKEFKKKGWVEDKKLQNAEAVELKFYKTDLRVRNALSRITFSTDDSGSFAPFGIEEITFLYQPVLYIMFDDTFTAGQIVDRLNEIGKSGFGKKGSIGRGHFKVELDTNFDGFKKVESDCYLTLSPTILNKQPNIQKAYYNIFNRFGKHHGSNTPFKKPLVMADSGAVIRFKEKPKDGWIGRAIDNGINDKSFVQGYSILVPFKLYKKEVKNG